MFDRGLSTEPGGEPASFRRPSSPASPEPEHRPAPAVARGGPSTRAPARSAIPVSVALVVVVGALLLSGFFPMVSGPGAAARASPALTSAPSSIVANPGPPGPLGAAGGASPTVTLVIYPDGTLSDPSAPVSISNGVYTLTADFHGAIVDQRNGSVLAGDGYSVIASPSVPTAVEVDAASDVTLAEMTVLGGTTAVTIHTSHNSSIVGGSLSDASLGVQIDNSTSIRVQGVTVSSVQVGLEIRASQGVEITSSRLAGSTVGLAATAATDLNVAASDLSGAAQAGLRLSQVTWANVTGNDLSAEAGASAAGLILQGGASVSVVGNRANDTATGFAVSNSTNVLLASNLAERTVVGVAASGGEYVTVRSNDLSHARTGPGGPPGTTGISIDQVLDFTLTGNDVRFSAGAGITIAYGVHGTVTNNDVSSAAVTGIGMTSSHNVQMSGNTANNLTATGASGYRFSTNGRLDFTQNTASQDYIGLVDSYSNRLWVVGSTFASPITAGLVISNDRELQVSASVLTGSPTAPRAIELTNCIGVTIARNTFSNWPGTALYSLGASSIVVSGNQVLGGGAEGIHLDGGTGVTVSSNVVSGESHVGISLSGPVNFTVEANSIRSMPVGLEVSAGVAGVVADNNATANGVGVVEDGSSGVVYASNDLYQNANPIDFAPAGVVRVYHNNFVDNGPVDLSGSAAASGSVWDDGYPVGGNYWSSWTGPDLSNGSAQSVPGSDGIVDQPYTVGGTIFDQYPLAAPWNYSAVTFSAVGLPAGAIWGVLFNGTAFRTSSSTLAIPELNGAFTPFSYQALAPAGYRSHDGSGHGVMHHQNLAVTLQFIAAPTNYSVVFESTGLPVGTPWNVTFAGTAVTTSTSSVGFTAANGSYAFSIAASDYAATPSVGTIEVVGQNVSVPVQFALRTYGLSVLTVGLPAGVEWGFTLGGTTYRSTEPTLAISVANGTYGYAVGSPAGFESVPASGRVTIEGTSLGLTLAFERVLYAVTWQSTGLPAGLPWVLAVEGAEYRVGSGALSLSLPNGSYAYSIGVPIGFAVAEPSGTVIVNGSALTQAVEFQPYTYPVTFEVRGLGAGGSWVLTLAGSDHLAGPDGLDLALANGSFEFRVVAPGYLVSPSTGSFTVAGTPVHVLLTFTATAASSGSSGVLSITDIAVVGALVAGAVVVTAVVMRGRPKRPEATPTEPTEGPPGPSGRE